MVSTLLSFMSYGIVSYQVAYCVMASTMCLVILIHAVFWIAARAYSYGLQVSSTCTSFFISIFSVKQTQQAKVDMLVSSAYVEL